MKRPIFIIIGVALVFILLGVWIYVLFFGAPEGNQFADLNLGDTTDTTVVLDGGEDNSDEPTIDINSPERLRQLTTSPTIGYQMVQTDASSTPVVYYIESGTGYIFSIDTKTGEEVRLSGKTVPLSRKGEISPNGRFVMIQSGYGVSSEVVVLELSTSSQPTLVTLTDKIEDFTVTEDNTFLYSIKMNDETIVKHYYPISNNSDTLFTIPFREVTIDWGASASDVHYIYPKAAARLEGFLYESYGTTVRRIGIDGFGLTAFGNANNIIFSKQVDGMYKTFLYNRDRQEIRPSANTLLTDKCVFSRLIENQIICANTLTEYGYSLPDDWYKGEISYEDDIWSINSDLGDGLLLMNTFQESGRKLDMIDLQTGINDEVFFINKTDQTLWLFDQYPE